MLSSFWQACSLPFVHNFRYFLPLGDLLSVNFHNYIPDILGKQNNSICILMQYHKKRKRKSIFFYAFPQFFSKLSFCGIAIVYKNAPKGEADSLLAERRSPVNSLPGAQ